MATLIQATYGYQGGQEENFVSFDAGDVFTLVSRDADGWWRVRKNNKEMYVPASYMQVVEKQEENGQVKEEVEVQLGGYFLWRISTERYTRFYWHIACLIHSTHYVAWFIHSTLHCVQWGTTGDGSSHAPFPMDVWRA